MKAILYDEGFIDNILPIYKATCEEFNYYFFKTSDNKKFLSVKLNDAFIEYVLFDADKEIGGKMNFFEKEMNIYLRNRIIECENKFESSNNKYFVGYYKRNVQRYKRELIKNIFIK